MSESKEFDIDEIAVTVLGAGIAGLTAAHELVERGFKVRVVERCSGGLLNEQLANPVGDDHDTVLASDGSGSTTTGENSISGIDLLAGFESVDVGGVARSQWATPPREGTKKKASIPIDGLGEFAVLGKNGDFDWGGDNEDYFAVAFVGENLCLEEKWENDLKKWLAGDGLSVQLVGLLYEHGRSTGDVFGAEAAFSRVRKTAREPALLKWVEEAMPCTTAKVPLNEDEAKALEMAFVGVKGKKRPYPGALLRRHHVDELIPGEHGFRFFPGFYRHLRDTMKRTYIYDEARKRYTDRTVHDNLREVEWQVMADPTRGFATAFRRKPPASIAEFIEQWHTIRNDLGFRDSDMLRFVLRLARYATSSNLRREFVYEDMSWWDFLSAPRLDVYEIDDGKTNQVGAGQGRAGRHDAGKAAKPGHPGTLAPFKPEERLKYGFRIARALKHSPRALVAMDATVTDARTQGNLALQLAMDQLGAHEMSDSTLDGPTSEAWFQHWKRFLEHQGVEFHVGEVVSLDLETGDYDVQCPVGKKLESFPLSSPPEGSPWKEVKREFVVCALDPFATTQVLKKPSKDELEVSRIPIHSSLLAQGTRSFVDSAGPGGKGGGAAVGEHEIRRYLGLGSPKAFYEAFQDLGRHEEQPEEPRLIEQDVGENWPYQTLSGVQLFFNRPTGVADGHIYFGESPWGLMGVSQMQYWRPRKLGRARKGRSRKGRGYRRLGNLSLVYGAWRQQGENEEEKRIREMIRRAAEAVVNAREIHPLFNKQKVREQREKRLRNHQERELARWNSPSVHDREDLVDETVRQIRWSLGVYTQLSEVSFPEVVAHHVDDFIQFRWRNVAGEKKKVPTWNLSPYLINLVGKWNGRPPGEPWSPNERRNRRRSPRRPPGYQLFGRADKRVVFAGAHMRTFTRMGTMEAANESGRHATNAILKYLTHKWRLPPRGAPEATQAEQIEQVMATFGGIGFRKGGPDPSDQVRPKDLPLLATSIAGDYCSVFDPERHEIHDLEFLKRIDRELLLSAMDQDQRAKYAPPQRLRQPRLIVESTPWPTDEFLGPNASTSTIGQTRRYPHLFDLLKLDELPDKLEGDHMTIDEAIQLLSAILRASRQALKGPDPVEGAQHLVRSIHDIISTVHSGPNR